MADSHPFANAGLGMFGSAERSFTAQGMQGGDSKDGFIGKLLAGLIGLEDKDKNKSVDNQVAAPVAAVPPKPQYEPQTAFPDILQQQYVTPYQPGYGSNAPIQPPTTSLQGFMTPQYRAPQPANPMAGFKTPSQYSTQPQVSSSGYHPVTDALWGK
jgi:hypothetical protein